MPGKVGPTQMSICSLETCRNLVSLGWETWQTPEYLVGSPPHHSIAVNLLVCQTRFETATTLRLLQGQQCVNIMQNTPRYFQRFISPQKSFLSQKQTGRWVWILPHGPSDNKPSVCVVLHTTFPLSILSPALCFQVISDLTYISETQQMPALHTAELNTHLVTNTLKKNAPIYIRVKNKPQNGKRPIRNIIAFYYIWLIQAPISVHGTFAPKSFGAGF